jgi:general secretion pathway protein G
MGKCGKNFVTSCLPVLQTHLDATASSEKEQEGSSQGYTLIELIIAVLIVLTLAAIAVPLTADYIHRANVVRAITEIRMVEKEIIFFETEKGYYPGGKKPIITFMLESMHEIGKDDFKDPWGTPYQYRNLAQGPHTGGGKPKFCRRDRSFNPLNYDFDIYSVGPDRQVPSHSQITADKGADDIVRAANGRYVGEGAKF